MTALRRVADAESHCVSLRRDWPQMRCVLVAGHEGMHQGRDISYVPHRIVRWHPGGKS